MALPAFLPPLHLPQLPQRVAALYRPRARPRGHQQDAASSSSPSPGLDVTMSLVANKGLLNPEGENNCFLNSAVQVRDGQGGAERYAPSPVKNRSSLNRV